MEIKNPRIVAVSAGTRTLMDDSIKKYELNKIFCGWYNNEYPLCSIYNYEIKKALDNDNDCLILAHGDVILEENPIPKLEKLFDDYDLIGVAGTSKIELKSPALWHLMGGGFQGGKLHGCVQHISNVSCASNDGKIHWPKPATNFGQYPHRVVMIDGVFMAMNRKIMENMRFDQHNPAKFHFYDLDFSLNCHTNGYKVGVGDILITHASPGLREFTEAWKKGEQWFLEKYGQ